MKTTLILALLLAFSLSGCSTPPPRPDPRVLQAQWLTQVKATVQSRWSPPAPKAGAAGARRCTLKVLLDGKGQLRSAYILESSRNAEFDAAALRAVEHGKALPEPADQPLSTRTLRMSFGSDRSVTIVAEAAPQS